VPFGARRERLVVLQAIELAGPELARRERRLHHDFDDARREALDAMHRRAQAVS
jgi:hypothetical protein